MSSKTVLRWLVGVVILSVIGWFVYGRLESRASDRVRAEIVKVVDEMALSTEARDRVRGLIEEAHLQAFRHALNLTEELGKKFDGKRYFDEVFDGVIERLRNDGDAQLADTVARERQHFTFTTTER